MSDAGKMVPLLKDSLDIVHQLVGFIRKSSKRQDVFIGVTMNLEGYDEDGVEEVQHHEEVRVKPNRNISLRPLCPTRWTVRASAINSVVCNYEHLMQTLDRIETDRTTQSDAASVASGLLKQMQMAETYFRSVVSHRLFALTDAFATSIQRPTISISEVLRRKRQVLDELAVFRDQFDVIFENATQEAARLQLDDMQLPRRRRVPARLDPGN